VSWLVLRVVAIVLEYLPTRVLGIWEKRAIPYPWGTHGALGIAALYEIFDRYVKIFEIWCTIRKRQISDVTAA
jgi:hypothetical protein